MLKRSLTLFILLVVAATAVPAPAQLLKKPTDAYRISNDSVEDWLDEACMGPSIDPAGGATGQKYPSEQE